MARGAHLRAPNTSHLKTKKEHKSLIMRWSILILSIPERLQKLTELITKLENQIDNLNTNEVEILALVDNRQRSIARKRNNLLKLSEADYVSFLDDDDDVSEDFIGCIMHVICSGSNPDCITFDQSCLIDDKPLSVSFGLRNPHESLSLDPDGNYNPIKRPPYHMCVYRRAIAVREPFREVWTNAGQSVEDIDWLIRLHPLLDTEHHIDQKLHRYLYNSKTTRSRQ